MFDEITTSVRRTECANAATVVIGSALGLTAGEKLVVICDHSTRAIAEALMKAAWHADAKVRTEDLDDLGPRPHKVLSDEIVEELSTAQASIFVARAPHGELGMRQHLLHLVGRLGLRHAHMPAISSVGFARGMRVDYQRVARWGERLLERLKTVRYLEAHSAAGTRLSIEMAESPRWFAQLGELSPGRWGNLPAGALYATPKLVEGKMVANASVGEFFGREAGSLAHAPVELTIKEGRIRAVHAPRGPKLQQAIESMLAFADNSDRVGLIAIGVNAGITKPTGEAIVDQNLPGLHIGIGDPAAHVTGATWSARTSFAACQFESTVMLDGAIAISRGQLMLVN